MGTSMLVLRAALVAGQAGGGGLASSHIRAPAQRRSPIHMSGNDSARFQCEAFTAKSFLEKVLHALGPPDHLVEFGDLPRGHRPKACTHSDGIVEVAEEGADLVQGEAGAAGEL